MRSLSSKRCNELLEKVERCACQAEHHAAALLVNLSIVQRPLSSRQSLTGTICAMQKKHKLRDVSMDDMASWPFADATFGVEFDNINNVTKLRQVPSVPQHVRCLQNDLEQLHTSYFVRQASGGLVGGCKNDNNICAGFAVYWASLCQFACPRPAGRLHRDGAG